jgi:hypothetical protein
MAHASQDLAVDNGAMATKRAAAKAEAAETIDIAARLAPFFPPRAAEIRDQSDDGGEQNVA